MLLALDHYFDEYKKLTPNFVAKAWLGNQYAGEHAYRGRTTEYQNTFDARRNASAIGKADLVLDKQGQAALLSHRHEIRASSLKLSAPIMALR